jgi:ATP adenylyltransferase
MEYILKEKEQKEEECIFCSRLEQNTDQKNLILYRGSGAFIIMNRFPYNNGHVMIVPNHHSGDFLKINEKVQTELFRLLKLSMRAIETVMKPHGFNVGMNLGRVAGAGVVDHLHFHLVPRWNGDTNFMPVLADTKVISEALDKSYVKLADAIQKLEPEK